MCIRDSPWDCPCEDCEEAGEPLEGSLGDRGEEAACEPVSYTHLDEGYLTSPHTSAGRIPTDAGYRAFVDDLLEREFGDETEGDAFDELRDAATKMDDLMDKTCLLYTSRLLMRSLACARRVCASL